ncbi:MAG: uroporphyrinogen-III C-methyltransferase [Coprococcus eutactus]
MVYLIGAGPGDPGLITVKGLEFIKQCDTIIYDRLGTYQLLEMVKPDCRRIYVGKQAGSHYKKQPEINEILVEEGRKGNMVVRLKGGDPFVFGRGGEEVIALLEAGIPFQVIPGITSAVAVPEVCGIPVTHRGTSRSFHVITGHKRADGEVKLTGENESLNHLKSTENSEFTDRNRSDEDVLNDYAYIRNQEGTSVFLMGLNRLSQIMERLVQTGAEKHTPVAVISKGTMPGQQIVRGDIQSIADKVNEAKLESPAIIVVGENAALDFTAPNRGPLQNVHVGLVGTPKLREKMRVAIDALGGQSYSIVDMSVEQTEEKDRLRVALEHIEDYSWLAFTSQNTITLFFKWLREWNIDVRKLAHLKFAVVGAGTRDALRSEGYIADYVPDEYTTSALAMGLANVMNDGEKLLLPRAVQGSETMLDILDKGGVTYEEIPVYDVVGRRMESIQYLKDLDVITFVSASGVRGFLKVLDAEKNGSGMDHMPNDVDSCREHTNNTESTLKIHDIMKNIRIAALGNVTEKALEKAGYHADIVPEVGDIEHLISSIGEFYTHR